MNVKPGASSNGRFDPHPLLAGGHRQTVLAHFVRRHLRWRHAAEDMVVRTGDEARLLLRVTWQPGPREERPALVVVHGLGGSDSSAYMVSTGALAFARGWHVVRMNMRGSGDGEALCPRLYNAGLDGDLLDVLDAVARLVPRVAVVGFSLGANLTLLALGRGRERLPPGVEAAVAISPPVDLSACADALERPGNRIYQHYFMRMLAETYRRRHRDHPELFLPGRELGARTIREYDHRITAPLGGYESAADYYARSSAGPHMTLIERPTLVLSAVDDPMVPAASVERWPLAPLVQRELTSTGGHVGYVGRAAAPGFFWAPDRALAFLEGAMPGAPPTAAQP
jgi:predicted alpha/beta-fold hydrolase